MKKIRFIPLLLIAGIILSLLSSRDKLCTELIANTQKSVDLSDISIFYSNINYNKIKAYSLKETNLQKAFNTFVPYSEGFLPKADYVHYKKALTANGEPLPMMFQDYYETDDFVFFAFPGDLTSFKVLDRLSGEVNPLIMEDSIFLSPMYVAHMREVNNQLIILAGQAHTYNALIYTVELPSLKVSQFRQLQTHPSALDSSHFTLTQNGESLFIADDKLQVYNPFTGEESFIPLPFKATGVINDSNMTLVYSEQDGVFHYTLLDEQLNLLPMQTITLPSSSCKLVDLVLKNHTLYLATLDVMGIRFKNYISSYNLSTANLTYCLGIEDASPLSLIALQ